MDSPHDSVSALVGDGSAGELGLSALSGTSEVIMNDVSRYVVFAGAAWASSSFTAFPHAVQLPYVMAASA